jgi:lipopolysaccharide export LptBFGC system permease protein LptF
MLRLDGGRLTERWDVAALRWEGKHWIGHDVIHRRFGPESTLQATRTATVVVPLGETPGDFVLSVAPPERLRVPALWATARARERLGRASPAHWTELGRRFATPAGIVLSMVLASVVGLRIGRRPTLARALGVGALLGTGVWLGSDLAALLGASGAVGAWPASLAVPVGLAAALLWAGRAALRRGVAE